MPVICSELTGRTGFRSGPRRSLDHHKRYTAILLILRSLVSQIDQLLFALNRESPGTRTVSGLDGACRSPEICCRALGQQVDLRRLTKSITQVVCNGDYARS